MRLAIRAPGRFPFGMLRRKGTEQVKGTSCTGAGLSDEAGLPVAPLLVARLRGYSNDRLVSRASKNG